MQIDFNIKISGEGNSWDECWADAKKNFAVHDSYEALEHFVNDDTVDPDILDEGSEEVKPKQCGGCQ